MEKTLTTVAYWIAVVCTIVSIIMRGLSALGIFVFPYTTTPTGGKIPLSYRTFFDGAGLFFLMAIASSVAIWVKGQKS